MIKVNDLIKIISIDDHDAERFIEVGQGGVVTSLEEGGLRIIWTTVNGINPENDACDDYFLNYNQVEKVSI